jgi:Domain of unknown function (DUF4124)
MPITCQMAVGLLDKCYLLGINPTKAMNKFIFLLLILVSPFASGDMFKCVGPTGTLSFSDRPCPKGAKEENVSSKKMEWLDQLKLEKPNSVEILDLVTVDSQVWIKYHFGSQSDSNDFIRLAAKLSNMSVALVTIKSPTNHSLGSAEIKILNKHDPQLEFWGRRQNRTGE